MGTQLPLPQRGTAPQFSAHICCGQTAGWIKRPLGRKVGLGPSNIVLDGDPVHPPQFLAHVYCGQTAGWMYQDDTWHVGRPRPRPHCATWGPSSPSPKSGHSPQFSAYIYTVSQKNVPPMACYNFDTHKWILIFLAAMLPIK